FPTTTWVVGDRIFDRYHVPIAPDARPGDYFVSIQVIDLATTGKAGQRDGKPGCNRFPTTTWVVGDRIFDRYHVPIAPDARPGDYTLFVTLYSMDEAQTTQTPLPATDGAGNAVVGAMLTTITVTPE
ncbi:MAG TPA: hypothetical protein VNK95_07800, partial [Caldilineaceae bacterium]|nr:hypothetical protein [Caldilineaceae bacterium]